MKYTANYNLKKPEGTDIVNIDDLNENADIIDQKLKELEDDVYNAPPNSVNDLAIGTRAPDQTQVPTSPGSGTLSQILSWLANRIKAITGKTNWWDAPPTTLQAAKTHMDAAAPHSGHETPAGAQAKANAAEANAKGYTDTHAGTKNTHGVGSGYYIAKTSRSDQLPAWNDVQGKPSNFPPSAHKSTHASGGSDALTPSDIGAETPAGAQAKAEAAAGAVRAELDAHLAEKATETKLGHVMVDGSTVAVDSSGKISVYGLKNTNVAIGHSAFAETYSTAVGSNSEARRDSTAIARHSKATGQYSLALGSYAESEGNYSVALGYRAKSYNDNEGILGGTGSVSTSKWIVPGAFTVNGTKNFEIPHPKPEKSATHVIRHGAVESPTPGDTLYRWRVQASKDNDLVTIDLPDYFIYLNKDVQIWVTPQGHFGNGYGDLNRETEQLEIHCQFAGEYNVLVIGTRNDDHQSVRDWDIKGVEREIGESWTGETYAFSVEEILEVEEIKEVSA